MSNSVDQAGLIARRKFFFEQIVKTLQEPPRQVDILLRQSEYYREIDSKSVFLDAELGDLWIKAKPSFYGKQVSMAYSLWQFGNTLKIAIVAYDSDVEWALHRNGTHGELAHVFGADRPYTLHAQTHEVYYEWAFDAANLYDSYQAMETYILTMRHLHFRVMRIIHDSCLDLSQAETEEEEAKDKDIESFGRHDNHFEDDRQDEVIDLEEPEDHNDVMRTMVTLQLALDGKTTDSIDFSMGEDDYGILLPELSSDEEAMLNDVIDAVSDIESIEVALKSAKKNLIHFDFDQIAAMKEHFEVRTQEIWPYSEDEIVDARNEHIAAGVEVHETPSPPKPRARSRSKKPTKNVKR